MKIRKIDLFFYFLCKYHTNTTTNTTMAYYMNTDDNMDYSRNAPFVKTVQFLPSIFAFSLGVVKDLRESLGIPEKYADDNLVVKYGYTNEFAFTTRTLQKKYEHIDNVNLQLLHHNYVDQIHMFSVDKDIRKIIGVHRYEPYNNGEFIIIPFGEMKYLYLSMCNKFKGKNRFFINKINDLLAENEGAEIRLAKLDSMIEKNQLKAEMEKIKRDSTIEKNLLKAEIDKRDSTIEILKRDSTIEKHKTDMKIMLMEQQLLEYKRIIEKTK